MPSVYFGHADLQMLPFLDADDFLRSFIARALIEGDLGISDAFFFMSEPLATHVRRDHPRSSRRNVLVRSAIREGIVRPIFRGSARTYPEALAIIRKQGIIGELDDADALATELHSLSPSPAFLPWPQRMVGASFRADVERVFADDVPAIDEPYAAEIWRSDSVRRWRDPVVKKAIEQDKDHHTLRRGELLDQVGRDIGWPEERKVRDAQELINFAEQVGCADLVRPYVAWVNQIYQRNQAASFELDAAMWSGRGVEQLGLYALLPAGSRKATFLTKAVRIPAVSALVRDPAAWFEIRRQEGVTYYSMLQSWRHGNTVDAPQVLEALASYASALEDAYPDAGCEYLAFQVCLDRVPANRGLLNALITDDTTACIIGNDVIATCRITQDATPTSERTIVPERAHLTAQPSDITVEP